MTTTTAPTAGPFLHLAIIFCVLQLGSGTFDRNRQTIRRYIQRLYRAVVLRSAWTWTLAVLLSACLGALLLGWTAYTFAHAGLPPLVYFWDNWVLKIYARIEFQYIWWAVAVAVVMVLSVVVKPWELHLRGGWRRGNKAYQLIGLVLFTVFIVLSWQLQCYIIHSSWVLDQLERVVPIEWHRVHVLLDTVRPWWGVVWWILIVTLLSLGCWGFLIGFGLLKNIIQRIPAINRAYIHRTQWIIENDDSPLEHIFHSSLYGALVHQSLGPMVRIPRKILQPILPPMLMIRRFFTFFEKFETTILHHLSLAWIADRLFGKFYYSMHFEMVLSDMCAREKVRAWNVLLEDCVHGALDNYAWDGLFAEDEDTEEAILSG